MLDYLTSKDLIKYVIIIGILYTILKIMPSQKLTNKDIILLVVVILIIFIIIDYKCFKSTDIEQFGNSNPLKKIKKTLNNLQDILQQEKTEARPTAVHISSISDTITTQAPTTMPAYVAPQAPTQAPTTMPAYVATQAPTQTPTTMPAYVATQAPTTMPAYVATQAPTTMPVYVATQAPTTMPVPATKPPRPTIPVLACSTEIDKIRKLMQTQIDELKDQLITNVTTNTGEKYFIYLLNDLVSNNILSDIEVQNIKNKVNLKLLTIDEVLTSLENLKSTKISVQPTNDSKYNELPSGYFQPIGDKISNDWDNQEAILNTDRWSVPMPRPPVCINNTPCKVCPTDASDVLSLKNWNNSARFSNTIINKNWMNDNTVNY